MKIKDVAKLSAVERLLYWIRERHAIYLRRKAGKPKPWTDDEILQRYFFTNPYRENDKVTAWFRKTVREPLRDDPAVIFAVICFRWFNWIPTGEMLWAAKLLTDWRLGIAKSKLRSLARVFTGAFNISNSGSTKPKIDRVCDDYIQPVWDELPNLIYEFENVIKTMEEAHSKLMMYPGMGGSGFMAYEVVCDLRYTSFLENAADKTSWSNPGPGARRGINRIVGRPLESVVRDYAEQSALLLRVAAKSLKGMPPLEMREIEHSLCEFDKYERARLGDGHMKRRYAGV